MILEGVRGTEAQIGESLGKGEEDWIYFKMMVSRVSRPPVLELPESPLRVPSRGAYNVLKEAGMEEGSCSRLSQKVKKVTTQQGSKKLQFNVENYITL